MRCVKVQIPSLDIQQGHSGLRVEEVHGDLVLCSIADQTFINREGVYDPYRTPTQLLLLTKTHSTGQFLRVR